MRPFSEEQRACQEDCRYFSGYNSGSKTRVFPCGQTAYGENGPGTSDVGDRPNARAIDSMIIDVCVDFPGSPAVGVAHLEDGLLQVGIGPSWRAMGPTRAILQAVGRLLAIAPQPLGSCLATDVEVGADPQDRPMERDDLVDEGETEFGHGQDLPGHAAPPFRGSSMAENCHPCPCTVCHPCPCTAQQVVRATRDVTLC